MCVRIMGENQQVDMDIKATADTGAQVDVIGTDHVERMGLQIAFLLRTKMSLTVLIILRLETWVCFLQE